jgi:long-chain acyl-CoA synthetase
MGQNTLHAEVSVERHIYARGAPLSAPGQGGSLDSPPVTGVALTIGEMLARSVVAWPEKAAILSGEGELSYRDLAAQAQAIACYLARSGVGKGDRVGFLVEKTTEAIIGFIGVALSGAVFVPIDYSQAGSRIQQSVDLVAPSAMIVTAGCVHLLKELDIRCPTSRILIVRARAGGGYTTWETALREGMRAMIRLPDVNAGDLVYLNMTSGTTGAPKAVATTHANIYWNTVAVTHSLGMTTSDVYACLFPVFGHPHELFARPLYLGGTTVLVADPNPGTVVRAINDYRITCLHAAASLYAVLVHFCEIHSVFLRSLRVAESGGMPVAGDLARRFKMKFGIPIVPVWGSTETSGVAFACSDDDPWTEGAIGRPCPHYEVMVVNEQGERVPEGVVGEMAVKGPAVCSEYYLNPGETAARIHDGWFHTDDLAYKMRDGSYCFAGRKSGMIKVAGVKVTPFEIEEVLRSHVGILEAAVVATPDRTHGEVPKAVIVLRPGAKADAADIKTHCMKRLPAIKIPRIVQFVGALPRTATGKVCYDALRWTGAPCQDC